MDRYICKKCKFHETDQIGDIVCQNKKCPNYGKFIEDEFDNLTNCDYFENIKEANRYE